MKTTASLAPPTGIEPVPDNRFWPQGWWKLMEFRIGIIPLPIYVVAGALIAGLVATGKLPNEISVAIVMFAFFGFMVWYGWLYMQRTMFQLTAVTQVPFAYIYSAMLFGGVLLVVHWLLVVRGYVLRREFASDAHFDANASASL